MSNELTATATVGIYAEVISQIYDSIDKRIREAVSNAFDAKAKNVSISVFTDQIIIKDDGEGMSEADLRNKYIAMGGGNNYSNPDTIGRIGIGALAVFALGDQIQIRTRIKGSTEVLIAELNLEKIKEAETHSIPLQDIKLGKIKGKFAALDDDPENFVEIKITNLSRAAKDIFSSEQKTQELVERLERILPLKYRNDEILLERLPREIVNKINDEKYIINVILHIPNQGYTNTKLYRKSICGVGEARIQEIIPIFPYQIDCGTSTCLSIYGYLYINARKQLPKTWQGINARVKNVTIEGSTYFHYEEDAAARVRIGGELFIVNIDENHAIQSNRSGFAVENQDYIQIERYLRQYPLKQAIDKVRKHSDIDSTVKKIIKKLEQLRNTFKQISAIEDEKKSADDFKDLDDSNVVLKNFSEYSLENNLQCELEKIQVDFDFIWASTLTDSFLIEYEDDDYYTIYVHSELKSSEFDVAGNTVSFLLSHCGTDNPLIIKKIGQLHVNLDNELIGKGDISGLEIGFIKVVMIMYLNYLRCNNSAKILYANSIADLSYR